MRDHSFLQFQSVLSCAFLIVIVFIMSITFEQLLFKHSMSNDDRKVNILRIIDGKIMLGMTLQRLAQPQRRLALDNSLLYDSGVQTGEVWIKTKCVVKTYGISAYGQQTV